MIRLAATSCFLLTLLCPVFCLAGADGGCADHGREADRNCEAMSVGAVVVESATVATPPASLLPAPALLSPAHPPVSIANGWGRLAARNRANIEAPPAATRQALLQVFLF